jgi:alkylhydroperoxidase family enzyme
MAWIRTIPLSEADERLRQAIDAQRTMYPKEYEQEVFPAANDDGGVIGSHSLIPDALHHAFATFGALLAPELPLDREQHEMIATVVSATNRCYY